MVSMKVKEKNNVKIHLQILQKEDILFNTIPQRLILNRSHLTCLKSETE